MFDEMLHWMYRKYLEFPYRQLLAPGLFLLVVIMLLFSPAVFAQEHKDKIWLDMTITSWHERDYYVLDGQRYKFNDQNFGLGLAWEFQKNMELKGGFANNSYDDLSLYVGLNFKMDLLDHPDWFIQPGIFAGLATGYDEPPEDLGVITPMGMLTLTGGYKKIRATAGYVPTDLLDSNRTSFAVFQVSYLLP